jgi:hypothetical protein
MPSRRQIRRLFKPGRVGHTAKGVPYHVGNSIRGLRWMFRIGKRDADRDTTTTRDGVPVNTHWDRPLMHGFRDPTGQWGQWQRITGSTWEQTKVLRTKKGNYRINSTNTDLAEMGRLGYRRATIEPKSWKNMDNQKVWDEIAAMGKKHGVPLRGYALRGNWRCIPYMEAAGIPTRKIR